MVEMDKGKRKVRDAGAVLDKLAGGDQRLRDLVEEQKLNVKIAEMIYTARAGAGITQAQLAELLGTSQSTIARLEDADYEGHSLTMLQRIAEVLHQRLEVRMVPVGDVRSS